jgi:hypothetical protein
MDLSRFRAADNRTVRRRAPATARSMRVARFVLRFGCGALHSRSARRRVRSGARDRPRRGVERLRGRADGAARGCCPPACPLGDPSRSPPARGRRSRSRGDADHPRAVRGARAASGRLTWSAARSSGCRRDGARAATSSAAPATRWSSRQTNSSTSAPSSFHPRRRGLSRRPSVRRSRLTVRRRLRSSSRRPWSTPNGSADRRDGSTRASCDQWMRHSCSSLASDPSI